jgi:hypothetical protein
MAISVKVQVFKEINDAKWTAKQDWQAFEALEM